MPFCFAILLKDCLLSQMCSVVLLLLNWVSAGKGVCAVRITSAIIIVMNYLTQVGRQDHKRPVRGPGRLAVGQFAFARAGAANLPGREINRVIIQASLGRGQGYLDVDGGLHYLSNGLVRRLPAALA